MQEPEVVIDPADTSRRHDFRKQHLVVLGERVLYEACDRAEALVWLDGFMHGQRAVLTET